MQQFTAIGTYGDGSMQDLTVAATWTFANTMSATNTSTGLAMGVGTGTSLITASLDGISGSSTLTNAGPMVSLSPTSLNFGNHKVGKTSPP